MRKLKIIADSSADILSLNDIDFTSVPLKIMTDKREFIDNEDLSVSEMVDFLRVTPTEIQWITDDMGVFFDVESNVDWIIVTS